MTCVNSFGGSSGRDVLVCSERTTEVWRLCSCTHICLSVCVCILNIVNTGRETNTAAVPLALRRCWRYCSPFRQESQACVAAQHHPCIYLRVCVRHKLRAQQKAHYVNYNAPMYSHHRPCICRGDSQGLASCNGSIWQAHTARSCCRFVGIRGMRWHQTPSEKYALFIVALLSAQR